MEILALSSSTLAQSPRYAQIERRRAASASVPHSRSRSCLGAQDRPYRPPFLIRCKPHFLGWPPCPSMCRIALRTFPGCLLGVPGPKPHEVYPPLTADSWTQTRQIRALRLSFCGSVALMLWARCIFKVDFQVTFERHGIEGVMAAESFRNHKNTSSLNRKRSVSSYMATDNRVCFSRCLFLGSRWHDHVVSMVSMVLDVLVRQAQTGNFQLARLCMP